MGVKIIVAVVGIGLFIGYMNGLFSTPHPPPEVMDGWWGRADKPETEDESIRPFNISFSDAGLKDLQDRLRNTKWFEAVEGTKFNFGINPVYMRTLVDYWLNQYDWRRKERELNQYAHYKTTIEGIDIHFVRAVPKSKPQQKAKPILMIHGWPGSFYEFYKMLPMLIDPTSHGGTENDVFEVVCVSLPGYGYSEASHKQGLDALEAARIFAKLMARLGFDNYYLQGGDWGGMVVDLMSIMFPSRIRGMHTNFITAKPPMHAYLIGQIFPSMVLDDPAHVDIIPSMKQFKFLLMETGYMHIQATKPDTVGYGLTDSPVGLAAYIVEKFSAWTNPEWVDLEDGGLDAHWSKDDLLTNIMIYWTSGCITSSMRFYKEIIPKSMEYVEYINTVPAGLVDAPHELVRSQKSWAASHFTDIVSFTSIPTGGHFACFEVPQLMTEDLRQFVRKVEQRLIKKTAL